MSQTPREGLGLSDEELQHLRKDLEFGRAALLVLCDEGEVKTTTDYLAAAGCRPESHVIDEAKLHTAAEAPQSCAGVRPEYMSGVAPKGSSKARDLRLGNVSLLGSLSYRSRVTSWRSKSDADPSTTRS
jgi:hypothetical protein